MRQAWWVASDQWWASTNESALLANIARLPVGFIGLKASKELLTKFNDSLKNYGDGLDVLISFNSTVIQIAQDTHKGCEMALLAGGVTQLAFTGAKLLTEEGLSICATKMAVALVGAVGANLASQQAEALARQIGVSEDWIRIGADSLQLACLWTAAKAQRKGGCFAAGTEVWTANGPVPIEQVHVGQRVLTGQLPTGSSSPVEGTGIDPANWRQVLLQMPDAAHPGELIQITMLQPLSWLGQQGAAMGSWISLSLPEMSISGQAEVVSIEACPAIDGGAGRVVLATFQRVADNVLEIGLAGLDTPLEVTANHPIWSADRSEWLAAGDLQIGEHLLGRDGQTVTVESITAESGLHVVYNMTVDGDHRYLVTELGVVVHNACPFTDGGPWESMSDSCGLTEALTNVKKIGRTHNDLIKYGFTEMWVGKAPDGSWWSSFFNPTTGKWQGGHRSSHVEW